jgi:hypothetical protein
MAFFAVAAASMFDPLSALGCLLAGTLIRRYWLAILIALGWRTLLVMALIGKSGMSFLLPGLVGAVVLTSSVYLIRRLFRKRHHRPADGEGQSAKSLAQGVPGAGGKGA